MRLILKKVIEIKITNKNGIPIENALGVLTIQMSQKNNYFIILSRSNNHGLIKLDQHYIMQAAKREADFAPMDFMSLDEKVVKGIRFTLMNQSQWDSATQAYEMYREVAQFPDDHIENLKSGKIINPLTVNIDIADNNRILFEQIIDFGDSPSGG